VVLKLKTPFAPLLSLMPPPAGASAMMPNELVDGAGAKPLTELVGTGPCAT